MKTLPQIWKLTLSYDGTAFHGWQVQPNRPTVQGVLADTIARVTGERVLPQGSGRTDAGVHALGQVASFALAAPIPAANFMRALNHALPGSIRVLAVEPAPPEFHARRSALCKTYEYRIFETRRPPIDPATDGPVFRDEYEPAERICSPFLAPFAWACRWPLALEPMQRAAALLCGTHDFTAFAATDPDLTQRSAALVAEEDESIPGPNSIKTISASACLSEHDLLLYRVTGSGFLHHMVRNIVGTLAEIGRGSLDPDAIPRILNSRHRSAAGPTAPACGLFLVQVNYGGRVPEVTP
jgi:tRNA pseudouridine38-40 synthase